MLRSTIFISLLIGFITGCVCGYQYRNHVIEKDFKTFVGAQLNANDKLQHDFFDYKRK